MNLVPTFRMRLQATAACGGGALLWWRFGGIFTEALTGAFVVLALCAWVSPARYQPVQRVLDFLTRGLVTGVSWLLLGLVYFGLFTPLRMLGAVLGRDPLSLKTGQGVTTYLRSLPPAADAERFKRQF